MKVLRVLGIAALYLAVIAALIITLPVWIWWGLWVGVRAGY